MVDEWAAYQFDAAVELFGRVIDSASKERVEVGPEDHKRWELKYTMKQLLDSKFRLPRHDDSEGDDSDFMGIDGIQFDEVA